MRRPKPVDGRPAATNAPQSVDATLIDISRPAVGPAAAQVAGPMVITFSLATDVGRVRHNNEDYVQAERILRENRRYALWAVADGVGGGPQGEKASKTAIETVVDYLVHEPWDDPALALTQAFALANHNVYEITGEGAAASTMVAALVAEPEGVVTIANVGDSRAYIVLNGEARPITDDHSIVAARIAAGQITPLEARSAPDRNVLTRSIGSETDVLVDVFGPRQLQLPERLVLCTDGVHGMIDDATLGRIAGSLPIPECASALVAASVEAGGRDNATALVGGYAPVAPVQQVAAAGLGMAAAGGPAAAGASGLPPFVPSYARTGRPSSQAQRRVSPKLAVLGAVGAVLVLAIVATIGMALMRSPESGEASPSFANGSAVGPIVSAAGSATDTPSPPTASLLAQGQFSPAGSMAVGRSGATATLLQSGQVLMAGGGDSSAELYDPTSGKFTKTGSMKTARTGATATLLGTGKVLIAGGGDSSAELYDPTSGQFTKTGPMKTARTGATATLLGDGKRVLIAGGSDSSKKSQPTAEIYDPATSTFTDTWAMAAARTNATATLVGAKVLITGGIDAGGNAVKSAELFDPATDHFIAADSMAAARIGAVAALLPNGKVLVAGGSDGSAFLSQAEIFDPANGKFAPTDPMAIGRSFGTATVLSDGRVLIVGGSAGLSPTPMAEIYDSKSGKFSLASPMAVARENHTETLLKTGQVLIAGGSDGSASLKSAELYNP